MLAALLARKSSTAGASNIAIQILLDNCTAVACVNKSEGTRSKSLCTIAARIARWWEDRLLTVSAFYLPVALNILAVTDEASDWMLDPTVFRQLQDIWDPQVDLFAAKENRQQDLFARWQHQPRFGHRNPGTQFWWVWCASPLEFCQHSTGSCWIRRLCSHPLVLSRTLSLAAWRFYGNEIAQGLSIGVVELLLGEIRNATTASYQRAWTVDALYVFARVKIRCLPAWFK